MWRCVSFDITSVFSRAHIGVAWKSGVLGWPWRAGTEQDGDEEEGHYWMSIIQLSLVEKSKPFGDAVGTMVE